jgi:hypothetical protein
MAFGSSSDKATVILAVCTAGIVLVLIAYDPFSKNTHIPVYANSTSIGNTADEIQNPHKITHILVLRDTVPIIDTLEQRMSTSEEMTVPITYDTINFNLLPTANKEVVAVSKLEATNQESASFILECSVPARIPQDSHSYWSAILLNSNLQPVAGRSIIWHMSPGDYSFTSLTQPNGTAIQPTDLSGIAPGKYYARATASENPLIDLASCIMPFEITQGSTSSYGSVATPGESILDITAPELRIAVPTSKEVFSGPSSGTVVHILGSASDIDSKIDSIEVRWTAKWGLTGYRLATPVGQDNWSNWSYGIKFDTAGEKTVLVKATDNAGNKSWKAVTFDTSFAVDDTKPSLTVSVPAEGTTVTGSINSGASLHVYGEAFDIFTGVKSIEVRTDLSAYSQAIPKAPGDWSSWSYDVTFPTSGLHQLIVRATDNANNVRWQVTSITVQLGA